MAKKNPIPGSKPWKKGQSGNPKGRPKKPMTVLMDQLAKDGGAPLSRADVEKKLASLLEFSPDMVAKLAGDPKATILEAVIATHLLDYEDRLPLVMQLLDRVHGKAKQAIDHTNNGEAFPAPVIRLHAGPEQEAD